MDSPKYNRTLHVPWSPGATNDDKMATSVDTLIGIPIVITEKLDGSNASLEQNGCFARTHSGPPDHPSFDGLKALHASIKYKLPQNIQYFGEWLYAVHSITYDALPGYFLMFGIREIQITGYNGEDNSYWWSWEDIEMFATNLGVHSVPLLWKGQVSSEKELKTITESLVNCPSVYGPIREGVVIRIAGDFQNVDFSKYVMKWVRKDHVSPDNDHWKHKEIVKNGLCKK